MAETKFIEIFGLTFSFNTLIATAGTLIVVLIASILLTRKLSVESPGKPQLVLESLVDFIKGIVNDNLGKAAEPIYVWIMMTLFLFVFVANLLGLPFLVEPYHVSLWKSPTADPAVAFSLALVMNIISHLLGIRKKGFGGYFKQTYFSPVIGFPIVIGEELLNLFTLAMRLFGNIFAGEILLALIASMGNSLGLVTWLAGIPLQMIWQTFSLFIGVIQAYIFVTLSTVYLKDKITLEEEE
ncbi:MAG: F0F1 ATP synthase subunit A [Atopococcus tabaci]|uniref:ATP synthase subunit a n=1 Tax=Atopococcus tabaci TaxID=269774 RepID=A0AA43ZRV8_9LACT|nr:F0F1 ATP synthase subunit A [Atopococcus tabaci]